MLLLWNQWIRFENFEKRLLFYKVKDDTSNAAK